ncbi:MAG: hypothetical protein KAH23_09810 [Kiritimatiellae bacterium]|nr:hypothetical protein [Kiritimatiellia bacterium]
MKTQVPDKQAMEFIAAYDKPNSDKYDRHIVKIAKTWRSIMRSRQSVQKIVDGIMEDFDDPKPDDYGCGWDELKEKFTAWAVAAEWVT